MRDLKAEAVEELIIYQDQVVTAKNYQQLSLERQAIAVEAIAVEGDDIDEEDDTVSPVCEVRVARTAKVSGSHSSLPVRGAPRSTHHMHWAPPPPGAARFCEVWTGRTDVPEIPLDFPGGRRL